MKRFAILIVLMGLAILWAQRATAAESAMVSKSTETLSLSSVLETALQENPEIQAARQKWEAAKARIAQAWTPDKPRLDIERMYAPRSGNIISNAEEKNIAVTQELPFPSTLYLKSRLARKESEMAEAAYRSKERDILSRVKNAYAMLYLSRHAIHVFEENTDLMRRFSKVAESKYASGKASQGEVLKAQVELSKMQNMLITLNQEKETNQAMLNTLLNRDPQTPLGIPEEPSSPSMKEDLIHLETQALETRPDLREAALGVERSGTAVGIARSDYLPDLMLQYRQRNMMNGPDSRDAIVGFSVPLWFWKQGAMVKEAKADRKMAQAEYQTMKNMTLYDVKNLFVKVQTAQRLIDLFQTSVIPQAEEALKVAQAGYQSDKLNFLDLLDASRSLLGFRLEQYQHITDYEISLAELERAVGSDLKEAQ